MRNEIDKWIRSVISLFIVIAIGLVGYGKLQANVTNNRAAISTIEIKLDTLSTLLYRMEGRTGGIGAGHNKE